MEETVAPVDLSRVLYALNEKAKWEARYENCREYLNSLPPDIREERRGDLDKIMAQIEYYDVLLKEMKLMLTGSATTDILRSL